MFGLATTYSLDQSRVNMTSRSVLPDTFLPMDVGDDLFMTCQNNILGWLHPTKNVNLENSCYQRSEDKTPSVNKSANDMGSNVNDGLKDNGLQDAVFKVKNFLRNEVPAALTSDSKDVQKIEAVVFVDFVALEIEVTFQSWQDRTAVNVRDKSHSDVVRMHRLHKQLKESLAQQTEQAPQDGSLQDLQHQLLPFGSPDEFEDDQIDSQTMRDKAEALVNDVTSHSVNSRMEGAQGLALWAQDCPECRVHIAETMLKHDAQIVKDLLQNSNLPLAEAYPLAAMLHHTFLCPSAARKLKSSRIARELRGMVRFNDGSTTELVAKELSMAVRCMDMVSC